jgi:hypothetical protein
MAHGRGDDVGKAVRIALAAELAAQGLDDQQWRMYFDLIVDSLSRAAQEELRAMDPAKYEYRSDFARRYVAEGRAALLQRLLARRFGPLPTNAMERLSAATIDELDAIGDRLLSAQSLEEALGGPH